MILAQANEPWLDTIPPDWKSSRIRNVAQLSPGYSDGPPENDEVCTVVPMELLSETGTIDKTFLQAFEDVPSGLTLFEPGDVLFAKITPCMENGKGAFVDNLPTRYAFGSTEFHVLRPSHAADAKFLYYYTFNPIFRAYAAENMSGAAGQKRVSSRFLKDTRLFLPSLPERERIAAYLDASCAAIDAAVAAKQQQIDILDALQGSAISLALTRGLTPGVKLKPSGERWLGDIPCHWAIKRIKDIADLRSGEGIAAEDIAPIGEFPVYGGNGLRGYTSSFTHDGHFPLIGRQGALCGNINYASGKFWATEHAVVVTPLPPCDTLWLGELLRAMNLNQYSNAAAQPGLAVDRLKFLRLPVPPSEEQTVIAQYNRDVMQRTSQLNQRLGKQVNTLTAYRKSLIHECVTGQRRVTETDVEIAKTIVHND